MNLLYMALVGLAAGSLAKMLTPQKETGGWISSLIVGLIGAFVGGMLPLGFLGAGMIGMLIRATLGAFIVLWIYHKFLADKMNLKI